MNLSIPKTVLGRTGIEVSRLGFGCALWREGKSHWTPERAEQVWNTALDSGINFLILLTITFTARNGLDVYLKTDMMNLYWQLNVVVLIVGQL